MSVNRRVKELIDPDTAGGEPVRQGEATFGEITASFSHELRAPLNSILLWATELRRDQAISAERLHRGLEIIERNARSQAQLIEDLDDLSNIIDGKPLRLKLASADLANIVATTVEAVQPAADARRVRLDVRLPRQLTANVDPGRVKQVVYTLISSALRFTPACAGPVKIHLKRIGSNAEIRVVTSDPDIDPQLVPQVFDREPQADVTTSRRPRRFGFRLALVRAIVNAHGGAVHAESPVEGHGAAFSVVLPLGNQRTE